jgi:enoyl-CoA hydratase
MTNAWTLEQHGPVAVLTFARPPSHTMDVESMDRLAGHLAELARRAEEVPVVLLTGRADGYFVAHADLEDLERIGLGVLPASALETWARALRLLEEIPQPTIAAIDGQAWGGGNEIALACTLRIGSERAHLGQTEVMIGLIPGAGGTQRLPRLIGPGPASELILTGRVVGAAEALRLGWLNAVLPTPGFRGAAIGYAGEIAARPAPALFAAKRAIRRGLRGLDEGLGYERQLFLELAATVARQADAGGPRP